MKHVLQLRHRLAVRIAVLAFTTGFMSLLGIIVLFAFVRPTHPNGSWWAHGARDALFFLIFVGIPIFIVWLASRLVTRPLRKFDAAIQSLQASNYKVAMQPADITELDRVFASFNELIRRLRVEEELRKDLISDTSHEFNTPLTALAGQLAAIQEGKLPADDEHIRVLKGQVERLIELVSQLDAYTRARAPVISKTEAISLKNICQDVLKSNELAFKDKHIAVELTVADGLVITAQRKATYQILENLVQNAVRYSQATTLTIHASLHGISVTDNGIGVPDDSLPYLFERFYRVDKSRSRETGGLGLGLSIVKELVAQQGWSIVAQDAKPGLRFAITFTP